MDRWPKMSAQDKKWQRESDARTLAEAGVIRKTPGRMRGARTAAQSLAAEERKQATAMARVARTPRKKR